MKKYLDLVVTFQSGAVGLDARERARIADILQRIRNEDWCPLHWAVVVGQLRPDHEKSAASHRLIERRAVYVAELLQKLGVPPSAITIAKPEIPISEVILQSRVVLLFEGSPASLHCRFPRDAGGMRVIGVVRPNIVIERGAFGGRSSSR